jgi:flagellar motility protein MotE (MotC chaperone)
MALDPITALTVAGIVVQFVDFGTRVVTKGYKLYRSADGALHENIETKEIAKDLAELSTRLGSLDIGSGTRSNLSTEEKALEEMADGCKAVAKELEAALISLEVKGKHRKWKSCRQALKSVISKGKVDELANRMSAYRAQLELHILVELR